MFSGFDDGDPRFTILETRKFAARPVHDKRNDYSDSGHATKVASKLVGQWGTAKDATLVPVLFNPDEELNMREAFEVVFLSPSLHSLTSTSLTSGTEYTVVLGCDGGTI